MKKIIVIISIIFIIFGLYLAYQGIFGKKQSNYQLITVERGQVVDTVSVTGTVIPAKEIDLQFESNGKIKEITVAIGDKVLTDQILAQLDTAELGAQLKASQAGLRIAEVKLAQTLAGSRSEDIQVYQSAVDKAQIEVFDKKQALFDAENKAESDLTQAYEDAWDAVKTVYTKADQALLMKFVPVRQKYFNSSNQLGLSVRDKEDIAKNDLASAKNYLDMAEADSDDTNIDNVLSKMKIALLSIRDALARLRTGLDDSTISDSVSLTDRTSIETERINIDVEITNLTSAEQKTSSVQITNQANLNISQANLDAAEAALRKTQDELNLKKAGPRKEEIDLSQAEVAQAQANLLQIQEKINKMILRAPVDGLIIKKDKEQGETASVSAPIISMITTGRFQVEANVSETEIAKVSLGDNIEMTLDALGPDEKFAGKIIKIDPAETVISGVIYYKVTSIFDAEDQRIKSGMTVNLDIQTDKKENVLYLPFYAIKSKDSQKYVLVLEGKETKERPIKTGLEGDNEVEIIGGLKQGESVIIEK